MIRLAVLGSTRGTNLSAIIDAVSKRQISASLEIVISNKEHSGILEKARAAGVAARYVPAKGLSREAYDQQVSELLHDHQVDLVVLVGYMRILSDAFVKEWKHKIINVHPSLLPAFAGMMDMAVHEAVLQAGVAETGCTVHYVTEEVDAGPIVLQKTCMVDPKDTPEQLKERVQQLEGPALVEAIASLT